MTTVPETINASDLPTVAELLEKVNAFAFRDGAVLINVPLVPVELLDRNVALNRGYFAYPPTTQLYLAAALRQLGVPSVVLDLNFVLLEEAQKAEPDLTGAWTRALEEALATFDRPLVCVSLMFESTLDRFQDICRQVRAAQPDACIMVGGVAATADPDKLLEDGLVDLVFLHEGEQALTAFYDVLDGKPDAVPTNLVFRNVAGAIRRFPGGTGGVVDIDIRQEYPKIAVADYCKVGSLSSLSRMYGVDVPYATVLSRRGCRARCAFCGVRNFNGKGVRVRSTEDVVDEMAHLRDHFGVRHFDWLDDDLLYNRAAALNLFRRIAERLPDVTWVANNGLIASAIDTELLEAMQASGCVGFKVGLESGNPDVLKAVHKPTNLAGFYSFAKLAQDFPKMFVSVNLIMGFPGETVHQMRDSFVVSVKGGLDWNSFYVYQHLKNTELYLNYGSVSGSVLETDYSKDGQTPKVFLKDINPVRGAAFRDMEASDDLVRGYHVFDLPDSLVPDREQLKEIWFTYNLVSNFIFNPGLRTESETRLTNAVRWVRAVQQAYPRDAAMAALLYALERRLSHLDRGAVEKLRDEAHAKLVQSEYWQMRDRTFKFSALLDGDLPPVDPRCLHALGELAPSHS